MANKVKLRRMILLITLILAMCYITPTLLGCGPNFETSVFTYSAHPDLPLDNFVKGDLGVLEPEYARSYLVVAYRYLNDEKLGPKEQRATLKLWYNRLGKQAISEELAKAFETEDTNGLLDKNNLEFQPSIGLTEWLEARKKVNPTEPEKPLIETKSISKGDFYYSYTNCKMDAFATATKTLEEKIKTLGVNNPEVKEWLAAQDQVFSNCSETGTIPPPAKANSNPRAKADRAYQIAAAKFYGEQFDEAANLFRQISKDKNSPWQKIAPYLVARCLVRKSMLTLPPNKDIAFEGYFDRNLMTQAEAQIKDVLNDPALAEYHASAERLNRYAVFRLEPAKQIASYAESLTKREGKNFGVDLEDFTLLLDQLADDPYDFDLPSRKITKKLPELLGKQDLTDWVLNFQSSTPEALNYALQKWEKTQSLPWLVSTLSKIDSKHPRLNDLLKAASKVNSDSLATPTITFHKVRLLKEIGKKDEAIAELDKILATEIPISGRNQLYSQRMLLAKNLEDFLKYAQRTTAGEGYFYDSREIPDQYEEEQQTKKKTTKPKVLFDDDSTSIMNKQFPLSLMKETAFNPKLPERLRKRLIVATWTRAVILENEQIGKIAAQELGKLIPELKDGLANYLNASTPETKKFAAIFLILRYPALRPLVEPNLDRREAIDKIDSYRDNWWCSFDSTEAAESVYSKVERDEEGNPKSRKEEIPTFLTKNLLTQAQTEQTQLGALGTAPNYLCNEVVKWAKANPADPRVPEALHLAVKSTRYGCVDKKTLQFSKLAFQVLHKNFPNDPWTKKTPYFFGDQ